MTTSTLKPIGIRDISRYSVTTYTGALYSTEENGTFHFVDGICHSVHDQPGFHRADGTRFWYKNGLVHRDNDSPAIIWSDGSKEWLKDGLWHRANAPARILKSEKKHNSYSIDGIMFSEVQYWINGIQWSERDFYDS